MKKSVRVRVLCLVVAMVVLSGAVTAAAVLGSPYETLKRALMDALTYRNVTEEINATMKVNGVVTEQEKTYNIVGDNSKLSHFFFENGETAGFSYSTTGFHSSIGYTADDGTQWYYVSVSPFNDYYQSSGVFSMFSPDERNSAQMRFIELLADALIGDLKNNITMTSENGVRYIQGTLTGNQVPELAKAGIDVLIEQSGNHYGITNDFSFNGSEYVYEQSNIQGGIKTSRLFKYSVRAMTDAEKADWETAGERVFYNGDGYYGVQYIENEYYVITEPGPRLIDEYSAPATRADYGIVNSPLDLPMQSLVINYLHGEAEIDPDGNLVDLDVNGMATVTNIFGEVSEIEIDCTVSFSDIGTSNPVCPISGAKQLLTPDYLKARFGSDNISVYFLLNEDGSINEDSITTTYPGELLNMTFSAHSDAPYPSSLTYSVGVVAAPYAITESDGID